MRLHVCGWLDKTELSGLGLTAQQALPSRHPLVAAQMVKEDVLIIALLLLVVNMYITP